MVPAISTRDARKKGEKMGNDKQEYGVPVQVGMAIWFRDKEGNGHDALVVCVEPDLKTIKAVYVSDTKARHPGLTITDPMVDGIGKNEWRHRT